MSNGTLEAFTAPRDHTRDALRAAWHAAHHLAEYAAENVKDAERGLELARLAAQSAENRADAAVAELIEYDRTHR